MQELYCKSRAQWRQWLERHHEDAVPGVWLVYYRKDSGKPSLQYDESVEEALCFGWIDSIIRKLDEERFVRKFTPRTPGSLWSASNRKRVAKLTSLGLMAPPGLALVAAAKAGGQWQRDPAPAHTLLTDMHPDFGAALSGNAKAQLGFESLAPSHRRQYLAWINVAKREETRRKRIRESIVLLEQGKKLGLK